MILIQKKQVGCKSLTDKSFELGLDIETLKKYYF